MGTANVSVTFPSTAGGAVDERHGGAFVLYNVAAGPPEATAAAGADSNANPVATSIAVATGGAWAVDAISRGNAGTYTVTQAGQVERWEQSCGTSSGASSTREALAPGTVTLGWHHSKPRRYAHSLAAFAPAQP